MTDNKSFNFDEICRRFQAEQADRNAERRAFLSTQPQAISCPVHSDVFRPISEEATARATAANAGKLSAGYAACPLCAAERAERELRERLHRQGVPAVLLHSTLENWTALNEPEKKLLEAVRDFAREKTGFLVLLGGLGCGKSHLAVGLMRLFSTARFIKQSTLLRELRNTYNDHRAADPVEQCQRVGLLVLDEMGLSGGGRDESPMLHEILDYRYGEKKPTVLTANLNWDEMAQVLGERLVDRLTECAARVLVFGGKSHRAQARPQYFERPQER